MKRLTSAKGGSIHDAGVQDGFHHESDEKLVRRLVERITISDETVTVQFRSRESEDISIPISQLIQAFKADSIEALAEQIGIDPATLAKTVEDYNALCEAGEDTQFGKDAQYLNPINDGTYYAVKEYDMTRGNYGGILTNDRFEVITDAGEAIPGLYAAGIISSGDYFGDYYPGREALSLCAHGGYITGQNAAEAAK